MDPGRSRFVPKPREAVFSIQVHSCILHPASCTRRNPSATIFHPFPCVRKARLHQLLKVAIPSGSPHWLASTDFDEKYSCRDLGDSRISPHDAAPWLISFLDIGGVPLFVDKFSSRRWCACWRAMRKPCRWRQRNHHLTSKSERCRMTQTRSRIARHC